MTSERVSTQKDGLAGRASPAVTPAEAEQAAGGMGPTLKKTGETISKTVGPAVTIGTALYGTAEGVAATANAEADGRLADPERAGMAKFLGRIATLPAGLYDFGVLLGTFPKLALGVPFDAKTGEVPSLEAVAVAPLISHKVGDAVPHALSETDRTDHTTLKNLKELAGQFGHATGRNADVNTMSPNDLNELGGYINGVIREQEQAQKTAGQHYWITDLRRWSDKSRVKATVALEKALAAQRELAGWARISPIKERGAQNYVNGILPPELSQPAAGAAPVDLSPDALRKAKIPPPKTSGPTGLPWEGGVIPGSGGAGLGPANGRES